MSEANLLQLIVCPACGDEGGGDDSLAEGQYWCSNPECQVVSFLSRSKANERLLEKLRLDAEGRN